MAKNFGQLFIQSWSEYKKNFSLIIQLYLLFIALPTIISAILLLQSPNLFITIITFTITVLLSIIMGATLIYALLFKTKSIGTALKKASKFFLRYIWLSIVIVIALIILYLLLIIPGIIFTIYWIFAPYVLIRENAGIKESIKKSQKTVKGNWWKVLGYHLLLFIIFIIFNLILSSIGSLIFGPTYMIDTIFRLIAYVIITPLGISFTKNFYLDLRKR